MPFHSLTISQSVQLTVWCLIDIPPRILLKNCMAFLFAYHYILVAREECLPTVARQTNQGSFHPIFVLSAILWWEYLSIDGNSVNVFQCYFFLKSTIQTNLPHMMLHLHWFCLLPKPSELIYLYSVLVVLHWRGSLDCILLSQGQINTTVMLYGGNVKWKHEELMVTYSHLKNVENNFVCVCKIWKHL